MRKAFLYLSLISTVCFSAISRDFTYDGLTYTVLSESDKTVETKKGKSIPMNDKAGNEVSGDVVIPDIVYDGNGDSYTVIQIGYMGFINRPEITSITLPSTLRTIGGFAMNNIGATEIVVPAGVESIENGAFFDCSNLTNVTFECTELTTGGGEVWDDIGVFRDCPVLESVELSGVSTLSEGFFLECPNLREVRLPECLTSIEDLAFYNCTGLESIWIDATTPPTITSNAFSGASRFILHVPAMSVEAYKNSDWAQYAADIKSEGQRFNYTYESTRLKYGILNADEKTCAVVEYLVSANENLIIPDKVTFEDEAYSVVAIAPEVFKDCDQFTSVEIPASVKEIGSYAFSGCSNLRDVRLPECLKSIEEGAFADCTDLETIWIDAT